MLYQALNHLASLDLSAKELSGDSLIPEKLFYNPVQLVSKPEEDCIYEAHRNYIDVHYILEGTERIGTADLTSLSTATPYSFEKDIEFLTGVADGYYNLSPGNFMVCFPNDAHKVAIMVEKPCAIWKIVFKIAVED